MSSKNSLKLAAQILIFNIVCMPYKQVGLMTLLRLWVCGGCKLLPTKETKGQPRKVKRFMLSREQLTADDDDDDDYDDNSFHSRSCVIDIPEIYMYEFVLEFFLYGFES